MRHIFKKEIAEAAELAKKLIEKEADYAGKFATHYLAAEKGFIDEVIEPKYTRTKLISIHSEELVSRKVGNHCEQG